MIRAIRHQDDVVLSPILLSQVVKCGYQPPERGAVHPPGIMATFTQGGEQVSENGKVRRRQTTGITTATSPAGRSPVTLPCPVNRPAGMALPGAPQLLTLVPPGLLPAARCLQCNAQKFYSLVRPLGGRMKY
jgi:hypothetical protein